MEYKTTLSGIFSTVCCKNKAMWEMYESTERYWKFIKAYQISYDSITGNKNLTKIIIIRIKGRGRGLIDLSLIKNEISAKNFIGKIIKQLLDQSNSRSVCSYAL